VVAHNDITAHNI